MPEEESEKKDYTVQRVPSAVRISGETCPLLDQLAQAPRKVRRLHHHQKGFFRLLRKGVTSREHLDTLFRFRDSVIRSALQKGDDGTGLSGIHTAVLIWRK